MTTVHSHAHSIDSIQKKGSMVLLALMIAFVRVAMAIIGALSLGPAVRIFFPEMLVLPSSPMLLLAVVAVDTYAAVLALLLVYAKAKTHKA